jgi:hypothetical protein
MGKQKWPRWKRRADRVAAGDADAIGEFAFDIEFAWLEGFAGAAEGEAALVLSHRVTKSAGRVFRETQIEDLRFQLSDLFCFPSIRAGSFDLRCSRKQEFIPGLCLA